MSSRKITLAYRALQIYLEHSLASSAVLTNSISPSVESLNGIDTTVEKAVQNYSIFLQKAQHSWSPYILAALDRMEEYVRLTIKARRNRGGSDETMWYTLAEISRRAAAYLVNAHLQGVRNDMELVEMWNMAATTCQKINLSHAELGLIGDEASAVPNPDDYLHLNCSLVNARECDELAQEATNEAVQAAWKKVARNCRIVRAGRRISDLYRYFPKCFVFSAKTDIAELHPICCKAEYAISCYKRSAKYLTSASTEVESAVKQLFFRASELICLGVDDRGSSRFSLWDPFIVNYDTLVTRVTQLSGLFATLRKYEAQAGSAPLAQRAARKEQLAAVRRELERIVGAIVASKFYTAPSDALLYEEDHALEALLTAATRSLRACAEEVSAEEKLLRYFTQQADAVEVSISPAHPHIQASWAAAAEHLRKAMAAAAIEEDDVQEEEEIHNNQEGRSDQHMARAAFMARLAEGMFADAADLYAKRAELIKKEDGNYPIFVMENRCGAADAYVEAGKAAIRDTGLRSSYERLPPRAMVHAELARQCVRAMKFHEFTRPSSGAEFELQNLAVSICKAFAEQMEEHYIRNSFPGFPIQWTMTEMENVRKLLNDACYLEAQLKSDEHRDRDHCAASAAQLQQRAKWFASTALSCGQSCLKQVQSANPNSREKYLLMGAVNSANFVRTFVFEVPGSVEISPSPAAPNDALVCMHHQTSCERMLQALRAYERGSMVESALWEKAAARWNVPPQPMCYDDIPAGSAGDPLLRSIGDHQAYYARQLTKCEEDVKQMGGFALKMEAPQDLGPLAPYLPRIKTIARATKDSRIQQLLADAQKKRSALGILHARASVQLQNVAYYTHSVIAVELGVDVGNQVDALFATLAPQSAQCFVYAAEATSAVTTPALREDIVALYTCAGDLLETNPYAAEQCARAGQPFSAQDALRVAEKAGKRYAAAARARAQGDVELRNAWKAAADATKVLVTEVEMKRGSKRRARVVSAEYSPAALARADELAAAAAAMEKDHFTCTDLCSRADEEDA